MGGLKAKLFFIIGLGSLAIVGLVTVALLQSYRLYDITDDFYGQRIPITDLQGEISESAANTFRATWLAVVNNDNLQERTRHWEVADTAVQTFEKSIQEMLTFRIHAESKKRLELLQSLVDDLRDTRKSAWGHLQKMNPTEDALGKAILLERFPSIGKSIREATDFLDEKALARNNELASRAGETKKSILWMLGLGAKFAILLFAGLGIFVAVQLSRRLTAVAAQVKENSDTLSQASAELAQSATQLSQASQEQAAALEESSASIEQISSMVEKNRDQAETAKNLTAHSATLTQQMAQSMRHLVHAMDDIQVANNQVAEFKKMMNEIAEKTKIIDEIVFQTRLLSFNASVEAERAGEHGRGFAVVAQEVGVLAQVSGKSALEISEILKNAIEKVTEITTHTASKVSQGAELCRSTEKIVQQVSEQTLKIQQSSEEIFAGSNEQSIGLRQVTSGIESMNQTTQSNAATAEEASAASEVLSQQAEQLRREVTTLSHIISGGQAQQPEPTLPMSTQRPQREPMRWAA